MENPMESGEWSALAPATPDGAEPEIVVEPLADTAPQRPTSVSTVSADASISLHLPLRLAPIALLACLMVRKQTSQRSQRWLARGMALIATLALVVVLFSAVILPDWRASLSGSAPQAAGLASLNATDQGWRPVATPYNEQSIALGVNSSEIGYSCATPGLGAIRGTSRPAPIVVSVSHDGGHTWIQHPTHLLALTCSLSVDPTDARDVVLIAATCLECASPSEVFRSFDGAHTWRQIPPPVVRSMPGAGLSLWGLVACCGVWVSNSYFLASVTGDFTLPRLAVSVSDGPFIPLDVSAIRAALIRQSPATPSATSDLLDPFWLLTQGSALYMRSTPQSGCPNGCVFQARSLDGGHTWQPFTPTYDGQPVRLVAAIPDGKTLVGQLVSTNNHTLLLRSADGGAQWGLILPIPAGMVIDQLYATPDGALYTALEPNTLSQNNPLAGVYALTPTGKSWHLVAPAPPGPLLAVSWDGDGHARGVWAFTRTYGSPRLVGVVVYWL